MENNRSFESDDPLVSSPRSGGETHTGDASHEETFKEEFIRNLNSIGDGQIVRGTVVGVTSDVVFVDVGYKSEGELPLGDFSEKPAPGDRVDVMIVRTETRDGKLILSKQRADELAEWDVLERSYREGLPIEGTVCDVVRGGFSVDLKCIKAFLPLSQCMIKRDEDQQSVIGKTLTFKIDKVEGKNNVVVSQRKYVEETRVKMVEEFFLARKEGDVVEGVVKNIVAYGAFVDLGGIDGLLHANDISWGRVRDPKQHLKPGDKLTLKILSLDTQKKKIGLGLKQLLPDPWESFDKKYEKGGKYGGFVKKVTNFGAFVELEEGIEGLLHVSELSWTRRVGHPNEILKTGDHVEVMVLDFDVTKRNVSLGLKQVLPNPWDTIDERYPVGKRISAKIVAVTKAGIFVELEEGIEGFLGTANVSWTKQTKNLSEAFQKGEMLDIVVLSYDEENRKVQVGLKQLSRNPWETLKSLYPRRSAVTGKVTSVTDFGVFVQVSDDIEGLIHVSHLARERVESPASLFKVGDEVTAVVLDIDEGKKKVTLSIKDYLNIQEKKDIQKYLEDDIAKTGSVPLGNLIDLSKIGK